MKRDATVPVRAHEGTQRPPIENRVVAKVQAAGSQDIGGGHARAMAQKIQGSLDGKRVRRYIIHGWGGGVA